MLGKSHFSGRPPIHPTQGVQDRKDKQDEAKTSSSLPAPSQSTSSSEPFKDTAAGKAIRNELLAYAKSPAYAKLEERLAKFKPEHAPKVRAHDESIIHITKKELLASFTSPAYAKFEEILAKYRPKHAPNVRAYDESMIHKTKNVRNKKNKQNNPLTASAYGLLESTAPSRPFKNTLKGIARRKELLAYAATKAHAELEKELRSKPLTIADMRPGDVLLRFDHPTLPHPRTEEIQMRPRLNGIPSPQNFGDYRNSHVVMWAKNPNNPGNTEARGMGEPQVVDARAGLGEENILSVQPTALQAGTYWVYRPTDAHLGDVAAQVGMRWADEGKVHYSIPELSQMGKPTSDFVTFDEEAKEAAVSFAVDAFEANPKWAENPPGTSVKRMEKGASCSSLIAKTYQPAKLRVEYAKKVEDAKKEMIKKEMIQDDNAAPAADLADAILADILADAVLANKGKKGPAELLDSLTGLMAHKPNGISPRTLEHLMFTGKNADGSPQFKPLGVLEMKQEDVLYPESRNPAIPLHPEAEAATAAAAAKKASAHPAEQQDSDTSTASTSGNQRFIPRSVTAPELYDDNMLSDDELIKEK